MCVIEPRTIDDVQVLNWGACRQDARSRSISMALIQPLRIQSRSVENGGRLSISHADLDRNL